MAAETRPTVVFIHGLWLHAESWKPWVELFRDAGYDAVNPGWPEEPATVKEACEHPERVANRSIAEVTEHYARILRTFSRKPIVIGHSFGGLFAQKLLGMGLAAGAVAIDPAQIRGVLPLPFEQIRNTLPVLGNPANLKRAVALTPEQFHRSFANAVSKEESDALHARYVIPSPARPLFEAALANLNPWTAARVDVRASRGPLLIIGGGRDGTVPEVVSRAAYNLYRKSPSVNDYKVFPDRGHSLVIDHGWKEVAETALEWLSNHGLSPTAMGDAAFMTGTPPSAHEPRVH
ncbi:alpha/beta hydrolase [Pyxidicoccus parkwayensis]|uniref:Alpha/beta hydrolase n=1 Tax=Pyxidicoccus parkwayensis TaxID=2813578 RepID=A0ABX7NSU2_9BACT|nr:alpha/beta hydrolase [Pyxidicoccus parkwaysis]QSQ21942.1 alpha/beta hydrolase [Pyxidicoccus parkwaysis]